MTEPAVEPLVTQCPECDTRFRVTPSQLDAAKGKVRCSVCTRVFLAADSLCIGEDLGAGEFVNDADLDDLLEELEELESAEDMEIDPLPAFLDSFEPEAEPEPEPGFESESTQNTEVYTQSIEQALKIRIHNATLGAQSLTQESDRELAEAAQSELTAQSELENSETPIEHPHIEAQIPDLLPSPERTASQLVRPLILVAALILVVVQILWFQFDEWVEDPEIRPLYGKICEVVNCTLPPRRALEELYAKNVVIRPHANDPDLLVVDAIIVNNADFPQRFPLIDMRFSSVNGILVLGRKIRPQEYLSGDAEGMLDINAHAPVHVSFEIDNPGPEGSNFDFNLL